MTNSLEVYLPYGRTGASGRVRVHGWLEHCGMAAVVHDYLGLSTAGTAAVLCHPLRSLRAERTVRRAPSEPPWATTVLVHREASPFTDGGVEVSLMSRASLSILDLDDALQWDWGGPAPRRLAPKPPKVLRMARAADRVIVGNDTLAEWASAIAREVVVIPSCVEPDHYVMKPRYSLSDPPRIGWLGSPFSERYLGPVAPALERLHRRTGARLVVMSDGDRSLGPLDPFTDRVRWSEAASLVEIANWDVGIMPLENGLWERGKCGYKLLQYAASGLPVVGSPVGVNREILARLSAPAPEQDGDWDDALTAVLEAGDSERALLGKLAREVVAEDYSYGAWANVWRESVAADFPPDALEDPSGRQRPPA